MTLASTAAADEVSALRSELVVERRHHVELELKPGYAELVVERTVFNGGKKHDQTTFMIDLPEGAVATGLRTLGAKNGRPHWYAGELMEAEAAAAKYRELTGIGGYYPKDPALLSWRSQSLLALQVFPCPPQAEKSVEYTLLLPTEYRDGAHHLALPALGTEKLLARVLARSGDRGFDLFVDDKKVGHSGLVKLDRSRSVELKLVPKQQHQATPLSGELGAFAYGGVGSVNHLEVRAAPKLSQVPKKAQVVVVIDTSRSVADDHAQLAASATSAYLSHFDGAEVEVLTFDRKVQRRHGQFVTVAQAVADLQALKVKQRNGSNVDRALVEADQLLKQRPAGLERRVLLFTDAETRSALTKARLGATLGDSRALLHTVIDIGMSTGPSLQRDDNHDWASWVQRTGGLVWGGAVDTNASNQANAAVYEELARPLRLDHVALSSALGEQSKLAWPRTLDEGQGFRYTSADSTKLSYVRVEAQLWAKKVRFSLAPQADTTKRWAALIFGSDSLHDLSEREMMPIAMFGGAVSPVTSYLAIEPGVRPSTAGIDWGASGGGQGFGSGTGRLRMGATRAGGTPPPDPQAWLEKHLGKAWKACGGKPKTAQVKFETTQHEIVDLLKVRAPSDDPVLRRCLDRAVWDLELPSHINWHQSVWTVGL